jgi:signal transduction histidine kinase
MKLTRLIGLTASLFMLVFAIQAQTTRESVTGAYVYNFARYTNWPQTALTDSFKLVLVTSSQNLIVEFDKFSRQRMLHDRPISFKVDKGVVNGLDETPNLIFIAQDRNHLFRQIYEKYHGQAVLIVTEQLENKSFAMINLYESTTGELLFEVNKPNIFNHHLSIEPEILLSGGSEIEVAALFRQNQQLLEVEQQRIEALTDSLGMVNKVILESVRKLREQEEEISKKQNLINDQQDLLLVQKNEMDSRNMALHEQQNNMLTQQKLLEEQKQQIQNQTKSLEQQLLQLQKQIQIANMQQSQIEKGQHVLDSLGNEIVTHKSVLTHQTEIISKQRVLIVLAIATVVMFVFMLLVAYRAFVSRKRNIEKLKEQNDRIEKINSKMKATNQSLYGTITQLKETQSQLVSSEKMASLGVLTAGIAHEINNPVNFIYTGINSLEKDYRDLMVVWDKVKLLSPGADNRQLIQEIEDLKAEVEIEEVVEIILQTIDDIKVGAVRSADIIKGLRNFSRVDKESMTYADIHEGLDSSLLLLRNKFKHDITITRQYGKIPKIPCYPGKLNQAFLNIISNAIDAIHGEGQISISTTLVADQVQIEIADTGIGIPYEIQQKIFDPFFTTKSVGSGVGLGLSITFGIVRDHNGQIVVKSKENQGSVFTILLPCDSENIN